MRVLTSAAASGTWPSWPPISSGPEERSVFDRSAVPLELARSRAVERSLRNVSFVEGELEAVSPEDSSTRRSAGTSSSTRRTRQRCSGCRRPGATGRHRGLPRARLGQVRSVPVVPTYDRYCRLCREAIASAAEIHMGGKLFSTFLDAGLPTPTLLLEAFAGAAEPMRLIAARR